MKLLVKALGDTCSQPEQAAWIVGWAKTVQVLHSKARLTESPAALKCSDERRSRGPSSQSVELVVDLPQFISASDKRIADRESQLTGQCVTGNPCSVAWWGNACFLQDCCSDGIELTQRVESLTEGVDDRLEPLIDKLGDHLGLIGKRPVRASDPPRKSLELGQSSTCRR